jgi:hypothetical protein
MEPLPELQDSKTLRRRKASRPRHLTSQRSDCMNYIVVNIGTFRLQEQHGLEVAFWTRIRCVLGSNLGRDTYTD